MSIGIALWILRTWFRSPVLSLSNKMKRPIVGFIICVGGSVMGGCVPPTAGILTIHPHSSVTAPMFCLFVGGDEAGPIGEIKVHTRGESKSKLVWFIEYDPDPAQPYVRPLACITYGKLPPGYKEKVPVIPLTPERLYYVNIKKPRDSAYPASVSFTLRSNPSGEPVKLEYSSGRYRGLQVITGL